MKNYWHIEAEAKCPLFSIRYFQMFLSWMKIYEFRFGFHWRLFLSFELTIFHPTLYWTYLSQLGFTKKVKVDLRCFLFRFFINCAHNRHWFASHIIISAHKAEGYKGSLCYCSDHVPSVIVVHTSTIAAYLSPSVILKSGKVPESILLNVLEQIQICVDTQWL